jgi:aryl-alcohol dehydrogenase-like predicted oxidoreductase
MRSRQEVPAGQQRDAYGPHTNEILIHDALYPYPDGLVIATKGGFLRGGPDYADFGAVGNREYLRQCAYLSARRLGVEQIDLYYLHSARATDASFTDQVGTLAKLRQQGLIRNIGLSNCSVEQFQAAREIVDIAAVTALYNVAQRSEAGLLAAAEEAGAAFSPWHPTTVTNRGTALDPRGDDHRESADRIGEVLGPICEQHGASASQIALAWLLHRRPFMLPIPGTSSRAHLEENLAAATIELTADEVDAITRLVPQGK